MPHTSVTQAPRHLFQVVVRVVDVGMVSMRLGFYSKLIDCGIVNYFESSLGWVSESSMRRIPNVSGHRGGAKGKVVSVWFRSGAFFLRQNAWFLGLFSSARSAHRSVFRTSIPLSAYHKV